MTKYYRRKNSLRLKNWNYSSNSAYFLTFGTYQKTPFFGEIKEGKMILNNIGKIVENSWLKVPKHFMKSENESCVFLDEYIVMPDHLHAIVYLDNSETTKKALIPSIVKGFKIGITKEVKKLGIEKLWQRGYYDQIIKNEKHLDFVRGYIGRNPQNWGKVRDDDFFEGLV